MQNLPEPTKRAVVVFPVQMLADVWQPSCLVSFAGTVRHRYRCAECNEQLNLHLRLQMLWPFWRNVQRLYKGQRLLQPGEDPDHPLGFFDKKWAGRGRDYRIHVEPIDIANWCSIPLQSLSSCSQAVRLAALVQRC